LFDLQSTSNAKILYWPKSAPFFAVLHYFKHIKGIDGIARGRSFERLNLCQRGICGGVKGKNSRCLGKFV